MSASEQKRLKRIRKAVIQRDGLICCYCDKELTEKTVTMEHIVPSSQKGTFNTTNLTVSCSPCNNKRGAKPFFNFIKDLNFSEKKIKKYKKLYFDNLRIKILNIAKEICIHNDYEIPQDLIDGACVILKIKNMNYDDLLSEVTISMHSFHKRNEIVHNFENMIHLIENR